MMFVLLAMPVLIGCRAVEVDSIPVTTTIASDAVHVPIQIQLDTAQLAKVVDDGIKEVAYVSIGAILIGALLVVWYIHRRTNARIDEMREMNETKLKEMREVIRQSSPPSV
jgi:hypothetical protein